MKYNFYTTDEIKPKGWLKRQLEIQANGLCGNLDKIWPDISDSAWIGGMREGWERVPYWLDGFIPLAYLLDNDSMKARAKKYIDAIISAQKADGWICPCPDEKRGEYDTWAVQLITKVFTVYYECSKDERIPDVIYNVLKNYYNLLKNGTVKLFDWGKFRWFETFISIKFIFARTKEDWLIELARILKEQGIDYGKLTEQWKIPLNKWDLSTHAVNASMALKSDALASELLKTEFTDKTDLLYSILEKYNGTPVGTFTGDECLSGLSPIQGTELCSVVELMYSYEWLYAFTGDEKWAQRLELAAFNALPAAISEDMRTHQYDQQSNQISCEIFKGKPIFRTNSGESHLFGLEPHFGCCTANFGQGWPKFALSVFMYNENTVVNAFPVPSELKTDKFVIKLKTEYPFKNYFKYTVNSDTDFNFKIRIPSFAENVRVNGEILTDKELSFEIKPCRNRVIEITYDIKPVLINRPYGLYTARCGSLAFSLPLKYEKRMLEYTRGGVERKYPYCDYELKLKSDWNYAFCDGGFKIIRRNLSDFPFSESDPPVILKTKLCKIDWGFEEGYDNVCKKVPKSLKPLSDPETAELCPYGCAKLRMTEMPKAEQ